MKFFQFNNLLAFILLLSVSTVSIAQYESRGKEFNYLDAEYFYFNNNYFDALGLYTDLHYEYPKVREYSFRKGVCHLELNQAEKAITAILASRKKKKTPANYTYYLARAYALNYQFDSAIIVFNEALTASNVEANFKKEIPHLIEQCNNGIEIVKNRLNVETMNIGEPINSPANEYSPVVNADESVLIYTYRGVNSTGGRQSPYVLPEGNGNYFEDVYVATKENETWSWPKLLKGDINTNRHEASVSLSPDGQTLYVYRDTEFNSGDLFSVEKTAEGWGEMKEMTLINSKSWEGSISVAPNGSFAVFSSDRPGGFGGRDLYYTKKKENGMWGAPQNMGEAINTVYDDDAPFIHADGVTFSFSSKGHNSIGGFDIFESRFITETTFVDPRNIGYPINTTADDQFFFVSGKGNAYYSSSQAGGKGQNDIYVIDVREILTNSPVLLLKGTVNPEACTITVKNAAGEDRGTFKSDPEDGDYQFYLNLGEDYTVTYTVDEENTRAINISTQDLEVYTERVEDVNFEKEEKIKEDEPVAAVVETPKPVQQDFDLADPDNFARFLKEYGGKQVEGVVFKVQIGAFLEADNFKDKNFSKLGELVKTKGEDGITRFTLGDYANFNKALEITNKAKSLGVSDAFMLVIYKGKSTNLNQLISQGLYIF